MPEIAQVSKPAPTLAPKRKRGKFRGPHAAKKFAAHMLQFHHVCQNDHCRRARQCRGAGAPCHDAIWRGLPEHRKCWLRGIIEALGRGERGLAVAKAGEIAMQEQIARDERYGTADRQNVAPAVRPPRQPILP